MFSFLIISSQAAEAQKFEGLAKTPPMGWNSWNKFGCDVSEDLIKEIADAMVATGLKDVGYEYIVIDDCWQVDRDENGEILPDPSRFASGMKKLGDYIHVKGLKFGIYSDAGVKTCKGRPGSRGYEFQDARSYARWGVDYLKYDWCNTGKQNRMESYKLMRDALYKAGRPIVFSLCEWGDGKPWEWGKDIGHLWRTTGDIYDCWSCQTSVGYHWGSYGWTLIMDKQIDIRQYAGPGHWNDPDMLEVGNGGMTTNEDRAHFSIWCMLAAPLMLGNDIRDMSDETLEIISNKEVIAVDQDPLGIQGYKANDWGDLEMWMKPLSNGELAICFLNRDTEPVEINQDWSKTLLEDWISKNNYQIDGSYEIRDLWKHEVIGRGDKPLKATIPGHDVLMLKLYKNR